MNVSMFNVRYLKVFNAHYVCDDKVLVNMLYATQEVIAMFDITLCFVFISVLCLITYPIGLCVDLHYICFSFQTFIYQECFEAEHRGIEITQSYACREEASLGTSQSLVRELHRRISTKHFGCCNASEARVLSQLRGLTWNCITCLLGWNIMIMTTFRYHSWRQ